MMQAMKEGLGDAAITRIANAFEAVYADFDADKFRSASLEPLDTLELKERVLHIIEVLKTVLPHDFKDTADILMALPDLWDYGDADDALSGFAAWPVTDFVAHVGIENPELSLDVLERLTPLFSAEFAIRDFIEVYPELVESRLMAWTKHENEHVRRLASEGSRSRLPWGIRLKRYVDNPAPILPVLEALKGDDSLYVRRSVANNLNDISKDHPDLVVDIGKKWLAKSQDHNIAWLVKHAARGLVKAGHPSSFDLLGFTPNPSVQISNFLLSDEEVKIGDKLEFKLVLTSFAPNQSFVLDYAIHYQKANGSQSPKVFKLKNLNLDEDESIQIAKKHSFAPVTTRVLYPGEHKLSVHINGEVKAEVPFVLTE